MKIENIIKADCAGNRMELFSGGSECARFSAGGTLLLQMGRVKTDGFTEAQGLPEKMRRHSANDDLSIGVESVNVIPFGCEYHIKRQWKGAGNVFELTSDIAADNGGRIAALELEELYFPIAGTQVEYLVYGEKEFRSNTDYSGSEMIVMLRVGSGDGKTVEFYAGDDFWRHRAASGIAGASSQHTLTITSEDVRYTRQILSIPQEMIPEKRPWRFKSMIAIKDDTAAADVSGAEKTVISGCFAAPAAHRSFRSFIRHLPENKNAVMQGDFPVFCDDGSHLSRQGRKIAHGDLAEVFNEWVWASGVMAKRGGACVMQSRSRDSAGSVIVEQMSKALQKTFFGD